MENKEMLNKALDYVGQLYFEEAIPLEACIIMAKEYLNKLEQGKMKIVKVTDSEIVFDNGSEITFSHVQDCCEHNYASFKQLEERALEVEFDENLIFEETDGYGFRFGSKETEMFFIPCYSEQNGYYSSDIDIFYNNKKVLNLECEEII